MKDEKIEISGEKIQSQVKKENTVPEKTPKQEKLNETPKSTLGSGGWGPSYSGSKPRGIGWR